MITSLHGKANASGTYGLNAVIGIYLFALASIAAGIFDIIWSKLEPFHQPVVALGDNIAGNKIFIYVGIVHALILLIWKQLSTEPM